MTLYNGISSKIEAHTSGFTNKKKNLKKSFGMLRVVWIIKTIDTIRRQPN